MLLPLFAVARHAKDNGKQQDYRDRRRCEEDFPIQFWPAGRLLLHVLEMTVFFAVPVFPRVCRFLRILRDTPGLAESGKAGNTPLGAVLIDAPLRHAPLVRRFPHREIALHFPAAFQEEIMLVLQA